MRNHKAIFERFGEPGDDWTGEHGGWAELFTEFIALRPLSGRELIETQQLQAQVSHRAFLDWSETTSQLHPKDRFKIERPTVVDAENPASDANYRIFNIQSVINVAERSREIELVCFEAM